MTRPLTKSELALVAAPIGRQSRRVFSLPHFLIVNACRGILVGILVAAFLLLTDTLGIFALVTTQSAPVTTALVVALLCVVKCVPLVLAVAVGLATYDK